MTCMSSLVMVARMRPGFMPKVFQSLETLHVNLPPTLAKSQVSASHSQPVMFAEVCNCFLSFILGNEKSTSTLFLPCQVNSDRD